MSLSPADIEETTKLFRSPGSPKLLFREQALVLRDLRRGLSVTHPATVGMGRTLCTLLAPCAVEGCKVAAAFVEPALLHHYKCAYEDNRRHFILPSLAFENYRQFSQGWFVEGAPKLWIISLTKLSAPGGKMLIESIQPDLVIFPEQHEYSARGQRLQTYLRERHPRYLIWRRP